MINGFMKLLITWLIRNDILKLFPNFPFPNLGKLYACVRESHRHHGVGHTGVGVVGHTEHGVRGNTPGADASAP